MKILTGSQIREADQYTIEHEPIESLALMERASEVIAQWICNNIPQEQPLAFFIGKGNNGGDGLAVARMLHNVGYSCSVYVLFDKRQLSVECRYNLERLPHGVRGAGHGSGGSCRGCGGDRRFARYGRPRRALGACRGADRPCQRARLRVISIDLPSGMLSEYGNAGREIVYADVTLTLEFPKLALLLPEAGRLPAKSLFCRSNWTRTINDRHGRRIIMRTVGTYRNWYCPVAVLPTKEPMARLAGLRLAGMMGAAVLATGRRCVPDAGW